jgi:transcriptional regulator with XRE-family HTH domain
MTASSSSQQAARQHLGSQLRSLREQAGLTGRAFAAKARCLPSKVSQVEKGVRPASAADVQLWCRVCGASPGRTEELLAEQATVARLWIAFRDLGRGSGLNATQRMLSGDMWERVRRFRAYQTKVIPGLLQTSGYMTAVLTSVRRERGVAVDDVAEAVAERIGRQGYLLQQGRQFDFVIEEPVLWFRPYGKDVQRDQLTHLLQVMRLPSVALAVIPLAADRREIRPRESFDLTDTSLVTVEMLTGFLSVTQPDEIAAYVTAWEQLASIAARGRAARAIIRGALMALDSPSGRGDPQKQ